MSNLQGITVAIAPSGIQYFALQVLLPPVEQKLASFTPTMPPMPFDPISMSFGPFAGGVTYSNILVTMSSGKLAGFDMNFGGLTQDDNGKFDLVLNTAGKPFTVSFNWNEQYYKCLWDLSPTRCGGDSGNHNDNFPYSILFGDLEVTIVSQFEYKNDSWQVSIVSVTPVPGTVTPNIPGNSVLNNQVQGSCGTTISDATTQAVDTLDFGGAMTSVLSNVFATIPATGQIMQDISFQFEEGPSGLTFPGNAGILAGVNAIALYKGTPYAGENPPTLPMPTIPADKHLAYNVSDYTFNSLMWAFYQAGSLTRHVVPGDLPDPAVLNTNNYQGTPLQALYDAYPGLEMTAQIVANAAPTVAFEQIYDLNDAGYAGLQGKLPTDVYTKLVSVKNQSFLAESDFDTALANAIGTDSANLYKTIIDAAALITAGVAIHNNHVVLNVVKNGNEIPVITFDVVQTDILQNFRLGISGAAQTLMFAFQIVQGLTTTTFISSTISGINGGDFSFIWNFVLQSEYAKEVAAIGNHGVALPRIPNFDFLMSEAVITLNPGYASVVTDVQHTADAGKVMYLASKMPPRPRRRIRR
jgi:LBP / BPI / CETP family, C-terminal domain